MTFQLCHVLFHNNINSIKSRYWKQNAFTVPLGFVGSLIEAQDSNTFCLWFQKTSIKVSGRAHRMHKSQKNLFPRSLNCWQHSVIPILPNWRLHFLIGCQGRVPHYVPLSIRQLSTRSLSFQSQKETQPLSK